MKNIMSKLSCVMLAISQLVGMIVVTPMTTKADLRNAVINTDGQWFCNH